MVQLLVGQGVGQEGERIVGGFAAGDHGARLHQHLIAIDLGMLTHVQRRVFQGQRPSPGHVAVDLKIDDGFGIVRGGSARTKVVVDHLLQVVDTVQIDIG
jgi:hypothetical protein